MRMRLRKNKRTIVIARNEANALYEWVTTQSPTFITDRRDCFVLWKAGLAMMVVTLLFVSILSSCNSGNNDMNGMDMNDTTQSNSSAYLDSLHVPADKQKLLSSLPAIHPEKGNVQEKISADGTIEYDTRQERNIATRYSGRIEKLYVKYMYQPVKKGELLMEIYSPEMVTEQQNFIFLLSDPSSDQQLISASKGKLMLLGMTQQEIDEVIKTKRPLTQLSVYSPYEGHIHEASSMNGPSSAIASNTDEFSLKEGMYVQKGQTIFNILNPHMVWAVLKIYADDAQKIKVNQKVELAIEGTNRKLQAKIDFIEPFYEPNSKMLSARVYIDNESHTLKVGMYVRATIIADSVSGLWIPKTATIDLGKRKIVFLKSENGFQSHEINTGIASGDFIRVTGGLTEDDKIALNAQYIQDSESFIKID